MGKRPVIVHPRNDFMFLSFDNLINLAAKWRYMFMGRAGNVPIVAFLLWLLIWLGTFDIIENGVSMLGLITLAFVVGM